VPDGPRDPATAGAVAQVFVEDLARPDLADDDAHHLARVLRLRPGEPVVAADGHGAWRLCRYRGPGSRPGAAMADSPVLEHDGPVVSLARPVPPVTIGFVAVKGDRPEWVVQKLTEAGVDRIVVLRSTRAVVRWDGERGSRALDRLRRVAREAAAQSRRAWLPEVLGVLELADMARLAGPAPLALAHPGGDPPSVATPAMAVGPEGGWDPAELASGDFPLVGLGPRILRAETAAVAAGLLLCALRDGLVRGADPPDRGPSHRGPTGGK
jgi:16S rRNA (uracil1498-N3)-methyltransferase